jgi:hypothetical protein
MPAVFIDVRFQGTRKVFKQLWQEETCDRISIPKVALISAASWAVADISVPVEMHSAARNFVLGGNPHNTGRNEHLARRVSQLALHACALTVAAFKQFNGTRGESSYGTWTESDRPRNEY